MVFQISFLLLHFQAKILRLPMFRILLNSKLRKLFLLTSYLHGKTTLAKLVASLTAFNIQLATFLHMDALSVLCLIVFTVFLLILCSLCAAGRRCVRMSLIPRARRPRRAKMAPFRYGRINEDFHAPA